ncbi:MAG: hypothetical protein CSA66_08050 [Proteobacteria bacterium]|nr:MAG: hypothetical protein CSA66_08050 [Pseudomonadota bacterium]
MAQDITMLATDLYQFLLGSERLLPRRRRAREDTQTWIARAQALRERLAAARSRAAERATSQLDEASLHLKAFIAELRERRPRPSRLRDTWRALGRNYEAMLVLLSERRAKLPSGLLHLKPRNYARNLFHVLMAVTGVLVYELLLTKGQTLAVAGTLLAGFVLLDVSRRVSPRFNERLVNGIFGKISRPGEAHHVPAATWYLLALLLGVALLPQHAIEAGTLILGFADPAASLAGKRWGRRKLYGRKSVVGSTTFLVVGTAVTAAFLAVVASHLGAWTVLGVAGASALAGTVAELFSDRRVDDNFSVPLAAGIIAALLL